MIQKASKSHILVLLLTAFVLVAGSRAAFALTFSPTELEWNQWSDLCRARYLDSGAGARSRYSNRVSPAEVQRHEAEVGSQVWYWLHHYCAGLVYLDRAQKSGSEVEAAKWLREAHTNIEGHYKRIDRSHYTFPEVSIAMARVAKQAGNEDAALQYLEESMRQQPGASSPYAFAALIHRESGSYGAARDVLLAGNESTEGTSAELHFLLGHIYIDLGDLDSAVTHAEKAYELGYPLPGLATKLRRLGRNLDP